VAPGHRTLIRRDWRAGVGATTSAVLGDPAAWLLGLAGFLARGGALLLTLPILSIPSPVLLSMLFRGEVGAIGRGDAQLLAIGVGLVLSAVAIGAVVVSAWVDIGLAERLLRDPETHELRLGRSARRLSPAERRSLVWWVASVQAIAIVPVIIVITMALDAAVRAATDELTTPSGTGPLVGRVLPAIRGELLLTVGVIVLVEVASSLATRRVMAATWGLLPQPPHDRRESRLAIGALARLVRSPGRVVATALAGWLLVLVTAGLVMLASSLAWTSAREVLVRGAVGSDAGVTLVTGLLVALFTAVWLGGLALVGFASAVRAGLWTADAIR
jgi:hypothetical protein